MITVGVKGLMLRHMLFAVAVLQKTGIWTVETGTEQCVEIIMRITGAW